MPKRLQRSLLVYLSKLKKPRPHFQTRPNRITSSTSWILSACKHPKTLSFASDRNLPRIPEIDSPTPRDIDRFLFKNSSYKNKDEDNIENPTKVLFESPRFVNPPVDLRASNRFFVSPGTSNSLIEEARSNVSTDEIGSSSSTFNDSITVSDKIMGHNLNLPKDSIAVLTYSNDPYEDFRRSMQEMVEAQLHQRLTISWDFMEDLLFCYLKLNDKNSHKYILAAFIDLIVVLRRNTGRMPEESCKIPTTQKRRDGDVKWISVD